MRNVIVNTTPLIALCHVGQLDILKKLYGNSVKKFIAALYDGESLSKKQIEELKDYLDSL